MPPFGKGGKGGIFGKRAIHAGETDFDVALCSSASTLITVVKEGMVYRFPANWRGERESKTAYD